MQQHFYDKDEVKKKANCIDVATGLLGLNLSHDNRCSATWRGGTNESSIEVKKDGYFDHGQKVNGTSYWSDVIDLTQKVKGIAYFHEAVELLGKHLGLDIKKGASIRIILEKVAEYIYTDEKGNPKHKVDKCADRHGNKEFYQHKFKDGKWEKKLDGIETYPYNLPEWFESKIVWIAEGEKCAEVLKEWKLPATTFPLGAGKWKPEWLKWFKNKEHVVILRDNDDEGYNHAQRIIWELRETVKEIKVLTVSDKSKGDVADFKEDGGTKKQLVKLVKDTEKIDFNKIEEPSSVRHDSKVEVAKRENKTPFTNVYYKSTVTDKGETKMVSVPKLATVLVEEIKTRFVNFPMKVGSTLFDHDRKTGEIRFLEKTCELFAWINEKSKHSVFWKKLSGCISQEELMASLKSNCRKVNMICGVPTYPLRNDVFYTHDDLPEPTPDAYYFNKLCNFFCPASNIDAIMIRAMFASPLYYRPKIDRPLWVVDSPSSGQGSGKSRIVEMLAHLYGNQETECSEPIWVDPEDLSSEFNRGQVKKRILSKDGRKKRIFAIDNVTGYYKSRNLASFITQGAIAGMAPYGHGEETRPNDLTYCLTANGATLDKDLIDRSFFIHIKRPLDPPKEWEKDVLDFIESNRLQIIADIIGVLKKPLGFDFTPATRFRVWEREILVPICQTTDNHEIIFTLNRDRQENANGESVEADTIREYFQDRIDEIDSRVETTLFNGGEELSSACIWIQSQVLIYWSSKAIPGFGGKTGRNAIHLLKNFYKTGLINELGDVIEKYPTNSNEIVDVKPKRGLMWNPDKYSKKDNTKVFMIYFKNNQLCLHGQELKGVDYGNNRNNNSNSRETDKY